MGWKRMPGNKLVLVVDDEPDILTTIKQILDLFGYPSILVQEASKVVEAAKKSRPRVILQDVIMPGLHVEGLVRQLKKDPDTKGIPVILFSASASIKETSKRAGADGYVRKPFDLKELRELLDRYAAPQS